MLSILFGIFFISFYDFSCKYAFFVVILHPQLINWGSIGKKEHIIDIE